MNAAAIDASMRSDTRRSPRVSLLAFGLALLLHLIWWMGMPGAGLVLPGVSRDVGPAVSYLPIPPGASSRTTIQTDVRALRSPTVFSLPTTVGFSRVLLEQKLLAPLPLSSSRALPSLRQREDNLSAEDSSLAMQIFPSSVESSALLAAPIYQKRAPETNLVMILTWLDGLSEYKTKRIPVEPGSIWDDDRPWEATMAVEVGPEGVVEHVFLEKPTASKKRNGELARMMRSSRLQPAGFSQSGRLVVRFGGRAAPATAPGSAAP